MDALRFSDVYGGLWVVFEVCWFVFGIRNNSEDLLVWSVLGLMLLSGIGFVLHGASKKSKALPVYHALLPATVGCHVLTVFILGLLVETVGDLAYAAVAIQLVIGAAAAGWNPDFAAV